MPTNNGRTVVADQTFSQRTGEQGTTVNSKYVIILEGAASPVQTNYTLDGDWTLIADWDPATMGFLLIKNTQGQGTGYATVTRSTVNDANVIEVAVLPSSGTAFQDLGSWFVYPGEAMRGCPEADVYARVKSGTGEVTCTVTTFPK